MNFDGFTGEVQHRLEPPGTGETVRAIRSTLSTSGRRIPEGNAEGLVASPPMEIDRYLTGAVHEHGERFDWREFVSRVGEIEGVDERPSESHPGRGYVDYEISVSSGDGQAVMTYVDHAIVARRESV